ncbi:hypothetical protein [Pseudobacteriovorax antillogorgiicola]|uniref:Cytochrome P460 n=1 Tax=Pseudobacteriovorax antillogorgiicola TaxID=1513793 RepID=A0A1Y6CPS4_9BACT|nr:hypothetical protein [Pseudobacteriovorax antillogorgiicola]TCS43642.1 hypothetical protein EDD56_13535 [Pseudobacteriovorax antillogorgiicola]SMF79945.1 hypothetical protein SAMN06296036_13418 [Pseudobacteriovorax antillogorgiicola]
MRLAILTSLCLAMASCGNDDDDDNNEVAPSADAGFTETITDVPSDYKSSSQFFTLTEGLVPAAEKSPHGANQIWYSTAVQGFVGQAGFTAPVGTIAVKEYDASGDGEVDGIAVMIKQAAGYDPDNNDWYYDYRDVDGTIKSQPSPGANQTCIGCHAVWPEQDYLPGLLILSE